MKIRNSYVSNSSSSSYIIAYDINFFGDLFKFFKDAYLGCDTEVMTPEHYKEHDYYFDNEDEKHAFEQKVQEYRNQGKEVICLSLDSEYTSLFTLLDNINEKNGGDKLIYIQRNEEN